MVVGEATLFVAVDTALETTLLAVAVGRGAGAFAVEPLALLAVGAGVGAGADVAVEGAIRAGGATVAVGVVVPEEVAPDVVVDDVAPDGAVPLARPEATEEALPMTPPTVVELDVVMGTGRPVAADARSPLSASNRRNAPSIKKAKSATDRKKTHSLC